MKGAVVAVRRIGCHSLSGMCESAMTASPAIEFRSVTVRYRLPDKRIPTLKEWAIRRLTAKLRYNDFLALQDITFSANGGETLGIIGANGAGKSTLLRVAAGILRPSAGEATVRGRVAPIIELGPEEAQDGSLVSHREITPHKVG